MLNKKGTNILSRRISKIAVLLLVMMMFISVTTTGVYAVSWGDGDTEEENKSMVIIDYEGESKDNPTKINSVIFKDGYYYSPYIFYNADEILGTEGKDKKVGNTEIENLVNNEKKNWSRIAAKIFKSESYKKGSTFSTSDPFGADGFESHFEEEKDKYSINLVEWLASKKAQSNVNNSYHGSYTSGLKAAKSLNEARVAMADQIARQINGSSSRVLEQRKNGSDKEGTLSQMKDAKARDVYYTNVVQVVEHAGSRMYNAYGLAFYDIEAVPLAADGLDYPNQGKPRYGESEKGDMYSCTEQINETKTEQNDAYRSMLHNGLALTDSNSFTSSNSTTYGQAIEIGVSASWSPIKERLTISGSGKGDFTFQEACATAWESGSSVTKDTSTEQEFSGSLAPHSVAKIEQNDEVRTQYITYDCPTELRYRVAVYSISGIKPRIGDYTETRDFCTKFGRAYDQKKDKDGSDNTSNVSAGVGAIENLYTRFQSANNESLYGDAEGHYKPTLKDDKVVTTYVNWFGWDEFLKNDYTELDGVTERIAETIDHTSRWIPMGGIGMEMKSDYHTLVGKVEKIALKKLTNINLAKEYKSEYNMLQGHSFTLPQKGTVEAFDGDGVAYFGFDSSLGQWQLSDKDDKGNTINDTRDAVTIDKDSNGRYVISAKEETGDQPVWLTWRMNDKAKYESYDKVTIDKDHDDGVSYPLVKVNVLPDTEGVELSFDKTEATGYENEALDLNTALPVSVTKDGKTISHIVEYELNDETQNDKAEIDKNGCFTAKEAGTYRVTAKYKDKKTAESATITVKEEKKIRFDTDDVKIRMGPVTEESYIELSYNIHAKDQYGNEWEKEIPELRYEPQQSYEGVTIEESLMTVTEPGDYKVDILEKDSSKNEVLGIINVNVTRNPGVDLPKAKEGLIYNGSEQTGVEEGEGYTLKNNKATDAGTYTAIATPKKGERWSDNGSYRPRLIKYEIGKKQIDGPKAKTGLVYNGSEQTGVVGGEGYTLTGNKATNVGTYTATAALDKNHIWDNGSVANQSIIYTIAPKVVEPGIVISPDKYTYNGKVRTPDVSVKDGSALLKANTDYDAVYQSGRKNAGKYKVSVTLKGNYKGYGEKYFEIDKAKNKLDVKGKTAKVKYKKLKKKNQVIKRSKAMTVSKANGKVTYKLYKVSKSKYKKYFKVNKKNGNITVKKKLKKGTYKVTVKVTAAGNSNYKSITKKATTKVKVK